MPLLGFGTFQMRGEDAHRAALHSLRAGYWHPDTAQLYGIEEAVGQALADSGIPRGEVFVTTKFARHHPGKERTTLARSLDRLGVGPRLRLREARQPQMPERNVTYRRVLVPDRHRRNLACTAGARGGRGVGSAQMGRGKTARMPSARARSAKTGHGEVMRRSVRSGARTGRAGTGPGCRGLRRG
ncbi:aldo/keto reductase [Streptomyces chrestomyceticus]|uniref:aldo/keto reductase n=1 Tax=Streptomyces chrestomyceticus TaxID=68185 RepID=UPI00379E13FD